MRVITLFITLSLFSVGYVFGQEQEGVSIIKDTTDKQILINQPDIRVLYASRSNRRDQKNQRIVEYYINNILFGNSIDGINFSGIDPNDVEDIYIKSYPAGDTTSSPQQMRITLKKDYLPMPISLTEVKEKYTELKDIPALFFIDGVLIQNDYDKYMVNENGIYTITIDKFTNLKEGIEIHLIRIVTRTKENMQTKIVIR